MPEETVVKKLTHTRIETPSEIRIVVNTLYRTSLITIIVITFAGLFLEQNLVFNLGLILLIVQWVYSLRHWNPVFREIKRAEAEKRMTTFGDKRSINHPFTYVIQKGSNVVINDDTLEQ
jgi:hypothetical protein